MTKEQAINSLIEIAKDEVGYLEKASNSNLYDKTANAGSANYTKYWADIYPSYQGQPWCACFVTWCFVQAFGKEYAEKLLKHYPYVYCPTLGNLFTKNANPTVGDIVIFYSSSSGTFTHTGIVTSVSGDYFTTIEGNTSSGTSVIANGGAVCAKGYYNSNLSGTKFCTPDYSILENYESEDLTMTQYEELNERVNALENKMIYNYVDENMPDWAIPTVQKLMNKGLLQGDEHGLLGLTDELLRVLVVNDRAGLYD
ncbi:MAG: CHAP domain-containing protein [Clostridiales bacterium]|nr:CHAP domain-containing protein [Clostridiales bacterium]